MAERDKKTELWVGVFLFVGLMLLGGLIIVFGRFEDRLHSKYSFMVIFDDASGLIKGSDVRMGGARIGSVAQQPELNENVKVQVVLSIDKAIRVPAGSLVQIASATILGDKMIVITPPEDSDGKYIEAGSVLRGGGPSGLDAIQNNAEVLSRDARRLMQEAEGTLLKVDSAVDDIRIVTGRLSDTLEKVNGSILSEDNLAAVDGTLNNVQKISESWAKTSEGLKPVLDEAQRTLASIHETSDAAKATIASANKRIDELGPALREAPKAVASISRVADKAGNAIDRIEKGNGLIGTLAYDKDVTSDAKAFIKNLKQQGILRYRDQETPEDDPRERFRGRRR